MLTPPDVDPDVVLTEDALAADLVALLRSGFVELEETDDTRRVRPTRRARVHVTKDDDHAA